MSKTMIPCYICLYLFSGLLCGCSRGDVGPKLLTVNGTVTVNNQPLSLGVLTLDPVDGKGGSYGSEIRDGKFVIRSAVGPKRVSILASRPSKIPGPDGKPAQEQYLPEKYNSRSSLTVDVFGDRENQLAFELQATDK